MAVDAQQSIGGLDVPADVSAAGATYSTNVDWANADAHVRDVNEINVDAAKDVDGR